ncbi:MAG: response regulator [Candidatus Thiodiazotropha sp.]
MAEQALHSYTQHPGDKPLVLIADDSRVVRVSLRNILKDHCDLIEVEDGQQAWEVLSQNPAIDLVFSDLSMPHLDGRALLNKMRKSGTEHLSRLPFIVVTGNEATPEIAQEMQQLGANGMVSKPFDADLITAYLRSPAEQAEGETASDWQDSTPQTDFLDNTPDRAQFMEIASRELSFAIRNKNELALALLMIDQFENILDHYSDGAIEHILLAIHDIVDQHIHPDDTLAYLGGGRFAILRPASNAIGTRYLGRRILEDISAKHFYLGESDSNVSASIGISAPDIKPGFRLADLMSLAEGRLKAALDSGGGKVVDKGNENLTPVSVTPDLSDIPTAPPTEHTRSTSHLSTQIERMAKEQVAEIKAKFAANQESVETQLVEYQQNIESLTGENRQLLEEVEHWKKLSAEADNLRRQLFEIESERQQVKLKFNEIEDKYQVLDQQFTYLKQENRRLIDDEEQRTSSLKQAHGFTEDENRRLEDQAKELRNRAEKAEIESLKLNQLVSSLRENSQLLKMQLDQAQQEINELKASQRAQTAPVASQPKPVEPARPVDPGPSDSSLLNDMYESELNLTATPNLSAMSARKSPPPVEPAPQASQVRAASEQTQEQPKQAPAPAPAPAKAESSQHEKPLPFRVEKEPLLFRFGFNFSAFTIASLILAILLIAGAVSLYFYLQDSPLPDSEPPVVTSQTRSTPSTPTPQTVAKTTSPVKPPSVKPSSDTKQAMPTGTVPERATLAEQPTRSYSPPGNPISEEIRMEQELTLRQMAEEEFARKMNQVDEFRPEGSLDTQSGIPSEPPSPLLPLPAQPAPSTADENVEQSGVNPVPQTEIQTGETINLR